MAALCFTTACSKPTSSPAAPSWDDSGLSCAGDHAACNGLDDDCDGLIDELAEPPTPTWYPDLDGDGFGDSQQPVIACTAPIGHIARGGDCDDTTATHHPDARDIVGDGVDQNCDGTDATCADLPPTAEWWEGDITLTGTDATETASRICASADGVNGRVTVTATGWTDLTALGCLCTIRGGLVIDTNPALTSLDGLPVGRQLGQVVELVDNPLLQSTAGLEGTTWLNAPDGARIELRRLPALTHTTGFDGMDRLHRLTIRELDALQTLDGLFDLQRVTESAEIRDNPVLTSVVGLNGLQDVTELRIEDNPQLSGLSGLGGLRSVQWLTLGGNALTDLSAFARLQAIDTRLTIRGAPELTSLSGLRQLERLGGLRIEDNPRLDGLDGLADAVASGGLGGTLELRDNPRLTDLSGLEWVTWIDGDLLIGGSESLTPIRSLHGLEQLRFVTGGVVVARVRHLPDLSGLDRLEEVGSLTMDGTGQPASDDFSLSGLPALRVVHQNLTIRSHPSLRSTAGLEALEEVGDLLLLDNPVLRSLRGLDGLRRADDLVVLRNPRLADISALYSLETVGDVCLEVPDNADEPDNLLAAWGVSERCP